VSASPQPFAPKRNQLTAQVLIVIAISLLTLAPTCGKRKPPLPPIERIPQRTELLSGAQRGNQVVLSWPGPRRNAGEGSVQSIRRIDVYRVAERPNASLAMTEEEFAARATLVGSVSYDEIKKAGENLTYIDTLEFAGVPARLRYAVRFVNSAGQSAAFSNFLLIEPAAKVAQPPTNVTEEESETAITIAWEAPKANIDGSTPVNVLGYNIYRSVASQPEVSQKPLSQDPIATTKFQDRAFKFGQKYTYVVRTVSLGTEGKPVESLNSNSVDVAPVDIYPPSAPGQISPAASPGRISLFWPANPEPDVAGYTIYRSTDPNLPKNKWTKLTPTLYARTTFADENVEAGKTYYYYITATDTAGNVSPPSEVVSETVP
jgi:fibronectin type 3 domain-containing protein